MNTKILAQNILNNPSNFTVEEIEKYFENYAESYNKLKQTLLEIRKNPMSFTSQPEITEQIAIEFANFYVSYCNKHGQTHSEEVFQEFLKTKQ